MNKIQLIILLLLCSWVGAYAQPCGVAQSLTTLQQSQINFLKTPLDSALKQEDLFHIDSLNNELKNSYATQGGIPDAIEPYYTLTSSVTWLNITNSLILSRQLIAADSIIYVDLWKMAKGRNPLLSYQPNSIFLRTSAEYASGLLKIADKETDLARKALYQSWATKALDSLATMQLPSGAFPFPDLRIYGDPVFGPIIQNFAFSCGVDSVNTIQNGWIVDDKGTGEFKFDAGIIANAYYEAYNYTGNIQYKNIAITIGNYLKPLKFNINYNYNTFVSLGLTRAYQLTNDTSYLNRAIKNVRFSVSPGQINNGRWMDGHNANSRYHNLIIQNIAPTIPLISLTDTYKGNSDTMIYRAVKNLVNYTYTCNSATGYRWLIKSYCLPTDIIPATLHDSISDLIGRHINQSAINGKYLDLPTMGEYLELPCAVATEIPETTFHSDLKFTIYPNPFTSQTNIVFDIDQKNCTLKITDVIGKEIKTIHFTGKQLTIDKGEMKEGIYLLVMIDEKGNVSNQKIIIQ